MSGKAEAGKATSVARKIAIICGLELAAVALMLLGALAPPVRDNLQLTATTVQLMVTSWPAVAGVKPVEHLEPLRPDLIADIKPDIARMSGGVTFVTGLFDDRLTARLIDATGKIIHEWPIDFFKEKKDKLYPFEALIHGEYLYANGDILINLDQKGIYRVDACGKVLWSNESGSHHSIDVDEKRFIWTPTVAVNYQDKRLFPAPFSIDRIGRFDPETGRELETIDLVDALVDSGVEGLASAENSRTKDALHINDVEILSSAMAPAFPMFKAGDILVSSRQRNTVFVLDRETKHVKWMRTGATQFQHDPDFEADGSISILDNRGSEIALPGTNWLGDRGGSRIISVRPDAFEYKTLFQSDERTQFYTPRRGRHQRLDNGNILITETDAGRAFEVTPEGDVVWQYVNRYNANEVGWLMSAARYPASYASIGKTCPPQKAD
ncbi:MAG: arylsulfotransferase family protein [Pseudomonadota bacterium]